MTRIIRLLERLEAAERLTHDQSGLVVVMALAQIEQVVDRPVQIIGIETGPQNARVRHQRLPGESVEQLHRRANPRGSWRAHPRPIMAPVDSKQRC